MLSASNIHVRLGKNDILKDVGLEAKPGNVTVIIGPNGSGKTTILKALTNEVAFDGDAFLNGLDIRRTPPQVMATWRGVLPQSGRLSFPFTVHEVVRLGLLQGIRSAGDDEHHIMEALDAVDMTGFGARFYQELSGGEAQRVQLARVLVQVREPVFEGQPRYLFLDEPISALDIRHQIGILTLARDYAEAGGGVLAVLHDLSLTAYFADHVILLDRGHVRAAGAPGDVLTEEHLEAVYGCGMEVSADADGRTMRIMPRLDAR